MHKGITKYSQSIQKNPNLISTIQNPQTQSIHEVFAKHSQSIHKVFTKHAQRIRKAFEEIPPQKKQNPQFKVQSIREVFTEH